MAMPSISRFANRVALVTGAGAGIGAAVCEKLVSHGLLVVGCARNEEPIQQASNQLASEGKPGRLLPYKCDISKDDQLLTMFKWIKENHGGVDVCINNAAFAVSEPLLESNAANIRDMLDLNLVALIMCTKYSIDSMRERGVDDGHVIQISSVLGHRLKQVRHCYAATKSAVCSLSEGFRRELCAINSNIRVSTVSPGMTKTHFHYSHYGKEKAEEIYRNSLCMQAEDVANAVIHVLSQPPGVQVHDIIFESTRTPA